MDSLSKQLLEMKEEAEKAKQEASEQRGQLKQLYSTLKTDFNCKDEKEAEEEIARLKEEQDRLEEEVSDQIEQIRNDYGF